MDSRFFDLDLPEETREMVAEKAAGLRLSFPGNRSRNNPIYRKKRDKRICRKCEEGKSLQEMITEFKLSERCIRKILEDNNVNYKEKKNKSMVEEIKLQLKLGFSKSEISRKTGKSRTWIYELIKKEGLK